MQWIAFDVPSEKGSLFEKIAWGSKGKLSGKIKELKCWPPWVKYCAQTQNSLLPTYTVFEIEQMRNWNCMTPNLCQVNITRKYYCFTANIAKLLPPPLLTVVFIRLIHLFLFKKDFIKWLFLFIFLDYQNIWIVRPFIKFS